VNAQNGTAAISIRPSSAAFSPTCTWQRSVIDEHAVVSGLSAWGSTPTRRSSQGSHIATGTMERHQ